MRFPNLFITMSFHSLYLIYLYTFRYPSKGWKHGWEEVVQYHETRTRDGLGWNDHFNSWESEKMNRKWNQQSMEHKNKQIIEADVQGTNSYFTRESNLGRSGDGGQVITLWLLCYIWNYNSHAKEFSLDLEAGHSQSICFLIHVFNVSNSMQKHSFPRICWPVPV